MESESESSPRLRKDASGAVTSSESEACPTRLIEDTPAEDDSLAFDGGIGPHRVAQAMAQIIQSPAESGGKMIGWEAGVQARRLSLIYCESP